MEILDIFGSDTAFKMATLTKTINHGDYQPGRIGQLGLYAIDGVPTTTIVIEEEYNTLKLVPTSTRGGPATPSSLDKRKARSFIIPHIAVEDSILADSLQNVRAYAQGMEPSSVLLALQEMVNKKLMMLRARLEPTIEYHRMGGIKGLILDADGATTIYNLFTEFDVAQQTAQMLLNTDTTDVNKGSVSQLAGRADHPRSGRGLCHFQFRPGHLGELSRLGRRDRFRSIDQSLSVSPGRARVVPQ